MSDGLSLPTLQERMKKLDQFPLHVVQEVYADRPFFHNACLSKGVTLEIVEYILDKFPDAATVESVDGYDYDVCDCVIRTLELRIHIRYTWRATINIAQLQSSHYYWRDVHMLLSTLLMLVIFSRLVIVMIG